MTMSVINHTKNTTGYHLFKLLNRGFAMLISVPLKETHAMNKMDDLVTIVLIYV
jgi:hypothetical protein